MPSDRKLLWVALVPALCVPFAAALLYFVIVRDAVIARVLYIAAKVFLVLWPLLAWRLFLRSSPGKWVTGERRRGRAALAGVVLGAAISLFVGLVMLTPLGGLVTASAGSIRERCEHLGILDHYWTFALFLSLAHSWIEEFYWRWFVYGGLRRVVSPPAAAVVSAAAFGSHHVIVTGQLMGWPLGLLCGTGVAVGGFLWALLYDRYGSLFGPWLAHLVVDLAVMAVGYRVLLAGAG
jgi:membrane protease YdiL (CAAX protease family)